MFIELSPCLTYVRVNAGIQTIVYIFLNVLFYCVHFSNANVYWIKKEKPFNGFDFEIKLKEVEDTKVFFDISQSLSLSLYRRQWRRLDPNPCPWDDEAKFYYCITTSGQESFEIKTLKHFDQFW